MAGGEELFSPSSVYFPSYSKALQLELENFVMDRYMFNELVEQEAATEHIQAFFASFTKCLWRVKAVMVKDENAGSGKLNFWTIYEEWNIYREKFDAVICEPELVEPEILRIPPSPPRTSIADQSSTCGVDRSPQCNYNQDYSRSYLVHNINIRCIGQGSSNEPKPEPVNLHCHNDAGVSPTMPVEDSENDESMFASKTDQQQLGSRSAIDGLVNDRDVTCLRDQETNLERQDLRLSRGPVLETSTSDPDPCTSATVTDDVTNDYRQQSPVGGTPKGVDPPVTSPNYNLDDPGSSLADARSAADAHAPENRETMKENDKDMQESSRSRDTYPEDENREVGSSANCQLPSRAISSTDQTGTLNRLSDAETYSGCKLPNSRHTWVRMPLKRKNPPWRHKWIKTLSKKRRRRQEKWRKHRWKTEKFIHYGNGQVQTMVLNYCHKTRNKYELRKHHRRKVKMLWTINDQVECDELHFPGLPEIFHEQYGGL